MINKFITEGDIKNLIKEFDTPLYIYDENTIISNINKLKNLCELPNFKINYATKANSNLEILKIIKEQGLKVDATGYGEVYVNQRAGFSNEEIYVIGNNFTKKELKQLVDEELIISLDAIDQIHLLGEIAPGYKKVMIRVNPAFGAGANSRVITGGKNTKFGIDYEDFDKAVEVMNKYELNLVGINQHIGSAYLEHESLLNGVKSLLEFIQNKRLEELKIINFGGGFGLNYERNHNNLGMDFNILKKELTKILTNFLKDYNNKDVSFEFEPGRFITGNSAILVGEVTSFKQRGDNNYIGTNLGFTSMIRPTLYEAYHEVEIISNNKEYVKGTVVGNICESGDYMCQNRKLIKPDLEDLVIVYDVGAYGFCMASNYNSRIKPMEIMIMKNQKIKVIRKRQAYEDLIN